VVPLQRRDGDGGEHAERAPDDRGSDRA
jgi:hypothetical protein